VVNLLNKKFKIGKDIFNIEYGQIILDNPKAYFKNRHTLSVMCHKYDLGLEFKFNAGKFF
jgi:hypothetical protein